MLAHKIGQLFCIYFRVYIFYIKFKKNVKWPTATKNKQTELKPDIFIIWFRRKFPRLFLEILGKCVESRLGHHIWKYSSVLLNPPEVYRWILSISVKLVYDIGILTPSCLWTKAC